MQNLSEIEILKGIRRGVLASEEDFPELLLPAISREKVGISGPGRMLHIHNQLELRLLFRERSASKGAFTVIQQLCLTPPEVPHFTLDKSDLERHITLRIDANEIYYLRGLSIIQIYELSRCKVLPGIELGELENALEKVAYGEIDDHDYIRVLVAMFLSSIIFIMQNQGQETVWQPAELIAAYIRANYYRGDLTIQEIAAKTKFSANYIQTVFRKRWNCTPVKYLSVVRLKAARLLLQKHKYQVKEVAALCGWNYVHYFSRQYREYFGHLPSEES